MLSLLLNFNTLTYGHHKRPRGIADRVQVYLSAMEDGHWRMAACSAMEITHDRAFQDIAPQRPGHVPVGRARICMAGTEVAGAPGATIVSVANPTERPVAPVSVAMLALLGSHTHGHKRLATSAGDLRTGVGH